MKQNNVKEHTFRKLEDLNLIDNFLFQQMLSQEEDDTVCYDDGTAEIVPVEYGGNIRVWNKRYAQPKTQSYYRHEGYVGTYDCYPEKTGITYALQPYTIYGFEWYNKHPEKKIKSIIKSAEQNTALNVLLFGIKLLKKVMTSD